MLYLLHVPQGHRQERLLPTSNKGSEGGLQ
nr:MAG TPA: hypothetical protein [Caudoviricetes sp.]